MYVTNNLLMLSLGFVNFLLSRDTFPLSPFPPIANLQSFGF